MPPRRDTLEVHTGEEVVVEHVEALAEGGGRFDISAEDGRTWRVDIARSGDIEVVTSWNSDGNLADVDLPEWIDDVTARLTTRG